jgi:hypothetical protein
LPITSAVRGRAFSVDGRGGHGRAAPGQQRGGGEGGECGEALQGQPTVHDGPSAAFLQQGGDADQDQDQRPPGRRQGLCRRIRWRPSSRSSAACCSTTSAWDRIADQVSEADFYRDDHRRIFRHIARLIEAVRPADVVTVYESLEKSAEAEQAGGMAYLGEIANNTPSAANIRRYAEIVRERAILRKLVTVGDEIAASALNPAGREAKSLLDEAESKVFEIKDGGARTTEGFTAIQPLLTPGGRAHPGTARPRQSLGHHRRADRVSTIST